MIQASHLPENRLRFLETFFGPGNGIAWGQLVSGGGPWGERVRPWVEDLRASDRPVLLPRVGPGGRVDWYALAFDARQARALRDDLTAFLGPTYSTFNGLPAELDPRDPVDAAVSRLVGPLAYRFAPAGPRGSDSLGPVLALMRSLWRQRPARVAAAQVPVARSLRNFEMALQAADWATAGAILEQLRLRGGVSLSNLRHLKVRRLAAMGQWDTIVSLPELPLVLADRRPAAVNDGLLAAVYHTQLLSFEAANNPAGAVDHFRTSVQGPYGALLRSRGPLRTPHALKMFMLLAVAEANRPRAESILASAPPDGPDHPYLAAIAALARRPAEIAVPPPVDEMRPLEPPQADRIDAALEADDYDTAFQLLCAAPPGVSVAQKMLRCAFEIGTLDAAAKTREVVLGLDETDRARVTAKRVSRTAWEEILRLTGSGTPETAADETSAAIIEAAPAAVPANWADWIERLNHDGAWPGALEAAQHGAVEWDLEAFCAEPGQVRRFVDGMASARGEAATATLRNAIPHLLAWFRRDRLPRADFKPIYWQLLETLAFDAEISGSDLQIILDLIEPILATGLKVGPDGDEAGHLVELLRMTWITVEAPRNLSWVLDVLDTLIDGGVHRRADLSVLLVACLASFKQFSRRVPTDQWDVLRVLCADLGQLSAFDETRPTPPTGAEVADEGDAFEHALDRKTVSLYSLDPQIVRRASETIQNRFKGATVRTSSDHDASPRLKALAQESDVFVVNTWDSLHAATGCIRQNRPKHLPTLYPERKNWSAIVAVVFRYAEASLAK